VPRIVSFEHNIYDNVKTKKMFFIDWSLQVVSHKIIAVSESVKHSLLSHGIRQDKIEVLLNGLDLSRYGHTRTDVLDGKIKTSFTFVFIGRLIYQKGVDVLLKAFAMLKEGELLITGQGQGKESLIKMTEDLGIKDRVKFLGVRKDIPNILSYSDCFILPSRFEGLGMVVLEAMASNTVIIIADFSAGIEMIRDGYNGLVFQREDSLGLAKKMRESLTVNRQRFYDNNKNLIQKFSISIYVDKLILI
jgi:glycosyltransferase involved in cell wall biosynthesis